MNTHAALELKGFGVAYGQRVVLDGITLSLLPKGVDVLMGPVKSGKSTLLRTLAGLYEGHALHRRWGEMQMQGEPLSARHLPRLVQQHASVFDQTLMQVLLEPIRKTQQKSSAEWQQLGLQWLSENGLGEFGTQAHTPLLQCPIRVQRSVLILSQVMLHPAILLVDEPTYGLSDTDAQWMVDWLKSIAHRCKLWVALHNQMQAKRLADSIVLIGGGRVVAHQKCEEFFQRPANEWVAQFIRTGSLSLPSLGAKAEDLADDAHAPPPLSEAAKVTICDFASASSCIAPPVASAPCMPVIPVVETPKTWVSGEAVNRRQNTPPQLSADMENRSSKEECRNDNVELPIVVDHRARVVLPETSRDGVELASGIGEMIFRDASAPRGFHWIVPGKLAGCPAPGVSAPIDYDLNLLARTGITKLITLTETDLDQEALQRAGMSNLHMPIFDREAPSVAQTHMLLVRMQRMIEAGEILAVHCKAGLGRTGTILAAWMIREGGLSAESSMERLRRIERGFIQSESQEKFLHEYESDLTSRLL
ncbi:MAG: ATP-binding cassette domain-containing protein [Sideroxydans sp.]|nr:ATP-binding cassette domain-containing protein [Sideroxydans sp.]